MKTNTYKAEQLIERLRDGSIETDEEADLLTKRRQALWTERSRMANKASAQGRLAEITASLELINTRLSEWRKRGENEADVLTKRRQALWTERWRLNGNAGSEVRLAEIAESIKAINERLRQFRR